MLPRRVVKGILDATGDVVVEDDLLWCMRIVEETAKDEVAVVTACQLVMDLSVDFIQISYDVIHYLGGDNLGTAYVVALGLSFLVEEDYIFDLIAHHCVEQSQPEIFGPAIGIVEPLCLTGVVVGLNLGHPAFNRDHVIRHHPTPSSSSRRWR